MNENLNWALRYAQQGFSIIPTHPDDVKKALFYHKDKPALTEDEIKQIWNKLPNCGIDLQVNQQYGFNK